MSIREIELELDSKPPRPIKNFLSEADRRCDHFFDTGANKTIPRFLPANYELIHAALADLQQNHPLLGNRFCEWGSGLGTATCLAALLDFEAWGVEIEQELVARARTLAEDFSLPARFLQTSLLPPGFDFLSTQGALELLKPSGNSLASYSDTDWTLDEIDLFYTYPWPEEQEATLALFDAVACEDAYLLCYYGDDELCAYRKTSS